MEIIIAELVLWLESVPRAQGGGAAGRTGHGDLCWQRSKATGSLYYWFCLRSSVFEMFQVNNIKKRGFYLVLVSGKGHGTTFPDGKKSE